MDGDSSTWSLNKKICMLHSTLATFLSLALIFAPSYVPLPFHNSSGIYTGILFLLGGLFCTAPDTTGVASTIGGTFLLIGGLFTWNIRSAVENSTVSPSEWLILAYFFGTGLTHLGLLSTAKPKKY